MFSIDYRGIRWAKPCRCLVEKKEQITASIPALRFLRMTKGGKLKRRRHVSKHVLKAQKEHEGNAAVVVPQDRDAVENASLSKPESVSKRKRNDLNDKVKDVAEVEAYLNEWKAHRDGDRSRQWKFNKNTQSWLIRHMYDADKVAKSTFSLLLEYLKGMQGCSQQRVIDDAAKIIRRYKKCDQSNSSQKLEDGQKNQQSKPPPTGEPDLDLATNNKTGQNFEEEEEGEMRWNSLSDHDKRKEYKRARQVLSIFTNKEDAQR